MCDLGRISRFLRGHLVFGALAFALGLGAQDPQDWRSKALDRVRGQSLSLGLGYVQGTLKLNHREGATGNAQVTDNGGSNFLVDYSGGDQVIRSWPMRTGRFVLGWNLTASLGQFQVDRQLIGSAIRGENVGTRVRGAYLAGAPCLFVRMGPLWEDRAVYCVFGFGVGAGAFSTEGNARFGGNPGTLLTLGGGVRPALYDKAFWQFQMGHWVLEFDSKYFLTRDPNFSMATYELYGLGLAYQIRF